LIGPQDGIIRSPAFPLACSSLPRPHPPSRVRRWAVSLAITFAVSTNLGAAARGSSSWGQPVVGLKLRCDCKLDADDYLSILAQKSGEPLDKSKVEESLKSLYATGRFTELRAEAEPAEEGVNLVFTGRCQYFVGIVQVLGAPGSLDPRVLVTASRLRLGQPLADDALAAARKQVADSLAADGYYRANLTLQVSQNPDTAEADVVVSVSPGPPARLNGVEFQGQPVFPPARLLAVARWPKGIRLSTTRLDRGLFRLRQFYVAQGRLQATASVSKRTYDPQSNTEKLQVQIQAGPLVRVSVEGAHIGSSKLKDLLPVFKDGAVDDVALARGERALESYFQKQGYLSASVKASRESSPDSGKVGLNFRVTLGSRAEFIGYGVRGNQRVPTEELMETVAPPAQGLFPPAPTFSRELLEQKQDLLLALYQSKGFLAAKVTPTIDENYGHHSGRWFVTFQIEEGPQTTVRNLTFSGVDPVTERALWSSSMCRPGQPYSPERVQTDRDTILDYLADRGYARADVNEAITPVPSGQVDVTFEIHPGAQERIRGIVVLGNQHTRTRLIRHELAIHNREPLNQTALLDSQRHLYEMGVFNQVQIAEQDQRGADPNKTILVGVEEGRRWTVGYGGGFEVQRLGSSNPQGTFKASPRVSLDVSRLDVGGRAQTFTLTGRLSDIEKGGGLSYLIPRLLDHPGLNLRINGLVDQSADVLTFTADRREASISIEKRFSPSTLLLARYSYRRLEALNISNRVQPQDLPFLSKPVRVGGLGASYVNDHRDDPADATRGSYSLADASVAWQQLGSEANFLRFTGQNSTYHKLGTHLVFARNTRFGVESPFGGLRQVRVTSPSGTPETLFTHDIPLLEHFFMGGSESHRGFSINQAGPRDPTTGFPVGGNALFFNSLELRVPLAERRFSFAFFHDAGNVYSTIRKMRLLKIDQNSPTDTDYTVHAAGMGVRIKTPAGPLRFDAGYALNPTHYQIVPTVNGVRIPEVQRLTPFQFFLSIGQSF